MNKFDELVRIANEEYDGHFTLMKFTTNWGCCFGTLYETLVSTYYMAKGNTMNEAIERCVEQRVDTEDIYNNMKSDGII